MIVEIVVIVVIAVNVVIVVIAVIVAIVDVVFIVVIIIVIVIVSHIVKHSSEALKNQKVSDWLTRSPIELSWTAKKRKHAQKLKEIKAQ